MADDIVQGGMFGGLGWKPLDNDAPFGSRPANTLPDMPTLPNIGGSAGQGAANIKAAADKAGITGGSIAPGATTGNPNATTGASVAANYFTRAVIVILGF